MPLGKSQVLVRCLMNQESGGQLRLISLHPPLLTLPLLPPRVLEPSQPCPFQPIPHLLRQSTTLCPPLRTHLPLPVVNTLFLRLLGCPITLVQCPRPPLLALLALLPGFWHPPSELASGLQHLAHIVALRKTAFSHPFLQFPTALLFLLLSNLQELSRLRPSLTVQRKDAHVIDTGTSIRETW